MSAFSRCLSAPVDGMHSSDLAFAVPLQISVCPCDLKVGHRDVDVEDMLLQPCLSELHYAALAKFLIYWYIFLIYPCQCCKLIHFICERFSIMMKGRDGLNFLFLSPLGCCPTSMMFPLSSLGDFESQFGYNWDSWNFNQLLLFVNDSHFAIVTHHNRWWKKNKKKNM